MISLLLAAAVAYCNALSSAQLAALYPQAGGTYVYGRERIGPAWGALAGYAFVAGKTASSGAAAIAVGVFAVPDDVAAAGGRGIGRTVRHGTELARHHRNRVTRVLVAVLLVVLGGVVVLGLTSAIPNAAVGLWPETGVAAC